MRRGVFVVLACALVMGSVGALTWSLASSKVSSRTVLHLVAPVKGSIVTPTSDLNVIQGPLRNRAGHRVGHLWGSCTVIEDEGSKQECTTTLFHRGRGQISLVGPAFNRERRARFRQGIVGGTGIYRNARGQAWVHLKANEDVTYRVVVIP